MRQGEAFVILFNGFVGHMAHLKAGDYFGEHNLHKIGRLVEADLFLFFFFMVFHHFKIHPFP